MYDLISIGSISIDLFFKGKSLTFKDNRFQLAVGGKYVVDHFYENLGGGGANVAIGARRNGLKTAVLAKVGNNPFKKIILEKLEDEKVSIHLCQFEDDYLNLSAILLNEKGERTIVHFPSPHQHIIGSIHDKFKLLKTNMVYFGSLTDVALEEKIELLKFLNNNHILTIMNIGVHDCRRTKHQIEELLKPVDILILNGHEFADLAKAPYRDIHFKENIINWYSPFLKTKTVVITEGANGSYAYFEGKVYHQEAVKPARIIDTTGAGDAFTAGFIAEYFKSRDLEQSMEKGARYASKILTKIGAN